MTNSVVLLGVVAFAGQIPMFLIAPFAGVWADRLNRRRLLVITQTLSMIQSFGLAAVAWYLGRGDGRSPRRNQRVIGLAVFQGLINAFDIPARQTFLVEMVDRREDLANAIALNSTMVHGARFIGPAIGGYLISKVGPAACFTLDGISYLGVIAALVAMRVRPRPPRNASKPACCHELHEGLRYVWSSKPIMVMLLLLMHFEPDRHARPFHVDARVRRSLRRKKRQRANARNSHGLIRLRRTMIAAIYLASRKTVVGLGRLIAIATLLFGLAIFGFSLSSHLWLSMTIVAVAGVGMLMSFASANTLIQTLTDDHMRGRVMSFFTMAFIGMAPWGNLIAGLNAKAMGGGVIGAGRTLMISGILVLLAGIGFAMALPGLRRAIRPIYIRKGIIVAPVIEGVETVTEVVAGPEHGGFPKVIFMRSGRTISVTACGLRGSRKPWYVRRRLDRGILQCRGGLKAGVVVLRALTSVDRGS